MSAHSPLGFPCAAAPRSVRAAIISEPCAHPNRGSPKAAGQISDARLRRFAAVDGNGVMIPPESSPSAIFRGMFFQGMGHANPHTNTYLPILLVGSGFTRGQHLMSMLQRLGLKTDKFASSTGSMCGMETV